MIPTWRKNDRCVRCGGEVEERTADGVPFLFCRTCGKLVEKQLARGKFLG